MTAVLRNRKTPAWWEGILAGRAKRGAGKILLDKSRIELVNGAMTYHASIAEGLAYYSRALTDMWPGKLACGALLTAAASFLDTDRALVLLVIGAMCVDLFFGLWVAFRRHRFRCGILARGVAKFPCYAFYILLVQACEYSLEASTGATLPGVEIFLAYLLLTDCVSILAHCAQLGFPVPGLLRGMIEGSKTRVEGIARRVFADGENVENDGKRVREGYRRGRRIRRAGGVRGRIFHNR